MKPDLVTRLEFGKRIGSTIVEITSDHEHTWIYVREDEDHEDAGHSIYLEPDEIDLFISVLKVFKNKILFPKRKEEE